MTGHAGVPTAPSAWPSAWIERHLALIPEGGRILDLAAGGGRHALLARDRGYRVTALDRDLSALSALDGIEAVGFDLETGAPLPFAAHSFDGLIVTNYLWRPLMAGLPNLLATGGAALYETFALGQERFGRPSNPDFLLKPGELLDWAQGRMRVVAYEDLELPPPRPARVQRIAAIAL
jgi:SAM-dependent methyltransferase